MKLSEQIETGSLPIDPECGHILMTAVLPGIKVMEQALETIGGMDLDADDALEFAAMTANGAIGEVYHDMGDDE